MSEQFRSGPVMERGRLDDPPIAERERAEGADVSFEAPSGLESSSEASDASFEAPSELESSSEASDASFEAPSGLGSSSEMLDASFEAPSERESSSEGSDASFEAPTGQEESSKAPLSSEFDLASGVQADTARVDALVEEARELVRFDYPRALALAREAHTLAGQVGYPRGAALAAGVVGWACMNMSDHEGALRWVQECLAGADLLSEEEFLRSLRLMAVLYIRQGEAAKAEELLFQCQDLARRLGSRYWQAQIEQDVGILCQTVGDYAGALDHLSRTLPVFEELGNLRFTIIGLSQIGAACGQLGDYSKALEFFHKGLALISDDVDAHAVSLLLNNASFAYVKLGEYVKAREYLQKARAHQDATGEGYAQAFTLHNLGVAEMQLRAFAEADEAFAQGLELARRLNIRHAEAEILTSIGELRILQERHDEALEVLFEALHLAEAAQARSFAAAAHKHLSSVFAHRGEFQRALQHLQHYQELERVVVSDEAEKTARGLQERLALERIRREREVNRLRNVELARALSEVENLNVELKAANRRLETLHRERNRLLSVISHDLRNPVTAISIASDLLRNYLGRDPREHVGEQLDTIERSAEHMMHLISSRRKARSGWTVRPEIVALGPIVERVVNGFRGRAGVRNVRLQLAMPEAPPHAIADPEAMLRVLDELLTNAFRFTPPDRRVMVWLGEQDHMACVEVRDEGPGLDPALADRLFGPALIGTGEEKTVSGISIARELVEAMDGTLSYESVPGYGATFRVNLVLASPMAPGEDDLEGSSAPRE